MEQIYQPELAAGELTPELKQLVDAFQEGLHERLGSNLHGLYLHGSLTFPRPSGWRVDVDFHAFLESPLEIVARENLKNLHRELVAQNQLAEELDGYYVLLDDAQHSTPPTSQLFEATDDAWALHRAHWHAGHVVVLAGPQPKDIVLAPDWEELAEALDKQLEFIREHPNEQAYGVLNLARLIYSWTNKDVVISKYQAAQWARANLPEEYQQLVDAAVRFYVQRPAPPDRKLFSSSFPGFLGYAESEIAKNKLKLSP